VIKEQIVSGTGTDYNTITVTQPDEEAQQTLYREIDNWDGMKHLPYRP
jgi:hypothetical protein